MFGANAGGFGLGLLATLIGIAGIVAALRTRRRRARYAETYASTGGIAYTVAQIGCSGVFVLVGIGLMTLAIIFRK